MVLNQAWQFWSGPDGFETHSTALKRVRWFSNLFKMSPDSIFTTHWSLSCAMSIIYGCTIPRVPCSQSGENGKAPNTQLANCHYTSLVTRLGVLACWPKFGTVCLCVTQSMRTTYGLNSANVLCPRWPQTRAMHNKTTRYSFLLTCAHRVLHNSWSVCTCMCIPTCSTDWSGRRPGTTQSQSRPVRQHWNCILPLWRLKLSGWL